MVDSFPKIRKINMKEDLRREGNLVHVQKTSNGGHGHIIGHVIKISKFNALKVRTLVFMLKDKGP